MSIATVANACLAKTQWARSSGTSCCVGQTLAKPDQMNEKPSGDLISLSTPFDDNGVRKTLMPRRTLVSGARPLSAATCLGGNGEFRSLSDVEMFAGVRTVVRPRRVSSLFGGARDLDNMSFVPHHIGKPKVVCASLHNWRGRMRRIREESSVVATLSRCVSEGAIFRAAARQPYSVRLT
jgi:hypothetical protein